MGTCLAVGSEILGACGGGQSSAPFVMHTGGSVLDDPSGSNRRFFVDANHGGQATDIGVTRMAWGRLVQVFGRGPLGTERIPMNREFLIAASVSSSNQFTLTSNPVTNQEVLIIERDVTDTSADGGLDQFYALLSSAEANLSFVQDQAQTSSGVFTMVPRNAALMVQFDDLLDPASIDARSVRVLTGAPANLPFEARVLGDPNHGDLLDRHADGVPEFYTTRVLIDLAISELESFAQDPPLVTNGVGLPSASSQNQSNVLVRIPTHAESLVGQPFVLRNLSQHPLRVTQNGNVDLGSVTQDVVRAVRSGGRSDVTGDANNGFLRDENSPVLVGSIPARIPANAMVVFEPDAETFRISAMEFDSSACAQAPVPGDVLVQTGVFAEVVEARPVAAGVVGDLVVRLLAFPSEWSGPAEWQDSAVGPLAFRSAYDPAIDAAQAGCFLTTFPIASGFPEFPTQGIFTNTSFRMNFSEPMDPASLTAFDSMTLTRRAVPPAGEEPLPTSDYVVGAVTQALDLRGFTFLPNQPLAHRQGTAESYFVRLASLADGPTDLAGNPIQSELPSIEITIRPDDASQFTGGRVSRFSGVDEEAPFGDATSGPRPEYTGQIVYRADLGEIHPRPVERFRALVDRTRSVPGLMNPFALGVQTPLSGLGSICQTVWRYIDFGMSLENPATHDLDIEGMYWSPNGTPIFDTFDEFSIRLSHARYSPDEARDAFLLPAYPQSGLFQFFGNNVLSGAEDPPRIVHPQQLGYTVNPGEMVFSGVPPENTRLMPWPLNRTVPDSEKIYYTWRDTSIRTRAGYSGSGIPADQYFVANNLNQPTNDYFPPGQVQSVGLPLLMEFRCYPDDGASGINAFRVSLATLNSSRPYFRAFATGGTNTVGGTVVVDPDTQVSAAGGFNPLSLPAPGQSTYGRDNTVYTGALDLVVRVSRAVSVWFPVTDPTTGELFDSPSFASPILEPRPESQPAGTELTLDFRGAASIAIPDPYPTGPFNAWPDLDLHTCPTFLESEIGSDGRLLVHPALTDARSLDTYGDHYNDESCTFAGNAAANHGTSFDNLGIQFQPGNGDQWYDDVALIDGARYYQVRINFLANEISGQVPVLSALALGWSE
tara:strand:+ start:2365 stop:5691 length:3327 start_codon:yes stop_codon:yes gene_type:complete